MITQLPAGPFTVTATAWTAANGTELGTATGKCQVMRNQFAVKCAANTVEGGTNLAVVTNPPAGTDVAVYVLAGSLVTGAMLLTIFVVASRAGRVREQDEQRRLVPTELGTLVTDAATLTLAPWCSVFHHFTEK